MKESLNFITPPECGGQIVEVSYAATGDGHVIEWSYDQCDQSHSYRIAKASKGDDGDFWNGRPRGLKWSRLSMEDFKARYDVD